MSFYASTAGIVGAAKPLLLGEVPELVEGPTPVVMEPKGGSRNEVSSDPGKPFAKKTAAKKIQQIFALLHKDQNSSIIHPWFVST